MRGRLEEAGIQTNSKMSAAELGLLGKNNGVDCGYDYFSHNQIINLPWKPKFSNYVSYYENASDRKFVEGEEMVLFLTKVSNFCAEEAFFLKKTSFNDKLLAVGAGNGTSK